MQHWEQILLDVEALILVFAFWPGARVAMERSRQAENRDWIGALMPIGLVVLFVIVLIVIAQS